MTDNSLISECLTAWVKCPAAVYWPSEFDTLLVADFNGAVVFWPQFEGECFAIVRLSDSAELDHDVLPPEVALAMPWRQLRIGVRVPLIAV